MSWTANANASFWAIAAVPSTPPPIDVSPSRPASPGCRPRRSTGRPTCPSTAGPVQRLAGEAGGIWTQAGVFDADGEPRYRPTSPPTCPSATATRSTSTTAPTPACLEHLRARCGHGRRDRRDRVFQRSTSPSRPRPVVQGADLAVDWAPNLPVDVPAQFSVWLVRPAASGRRSGSSTPTAQTSYPRNVAADVPVGDGYQVYVYYRANSGAAWTVYGLAAGTVDVTAATYLPRRSTSPSRPRPVVQGADLTVEWAPNLPVACRPSSASGWSGAASGRRSGSSTPTAQPSYRQRRRRRARRRRLPGLRLLPRQLRRCLERLRARPGTVDVTAATIFHAIDVTVPATPPSSRAPTSPSTGRPTCPWTCRPSSASGWSGAASGRRSGSSTPTAQR